MARTDLRTLSNMRSIKVVIRNFFFTVETILAYALGSILRPSRFLSKVTFVGCIKLIESLPKRIQMLLSPFLTELGRVAFDQGAALFLNKTLLNGAGMRLDVSEKTQRLIFATDIYESNIAKFVTRTLEEGNVFVDIGANVGYYTLLASKEVGVSGRVLACEPERENFKLLQENVQLNKYSSVTCVPFALGPTDGEVTLYINPLNRGGNSINSFSEYKTGSHVVSRTDALEKYGREMLTQKVRMRSVDSLCTEFNLTEVHIMKIDVEGFEASVIEGAHRTLQKHVVQYLLCETGPETRKTVLNALFSYGYTPNRILSDGTYEPIIDSVYPRDILFSRTIR